MDNFITFLTILAWPVAVIATILAFLFAKWTWDYNGSFQERLDLSKGKIRRWPVIKTAAIALVVWAFIIAF